MGRRFLAFAILALLSGCSNGGDSIVVTIEPTVQSIAPGESRPFTASVEGSWVGDVEWEIVSGLGSIDAGTGVFTAPASLPRPDERETTIGARSLVDGTLRTARAILIAAPLEPPNGPTLGGTRVALEGSGFDLSTTVTIDGIPVENLAVESSVRILFDSPRREQIGPADVVVTTASETRTFPGAFRYGASHLRFGGTTRFDGLGCANGANLSPIDAGNGFGRDLIMECNSIVILRNDGLGGFQRGQTIDFARPAFRATGGDFDGDGARDDLAALEDPDGGSPWLHLMLEDGNGVLVEYDVLGGLGELGPLHAADVDGDGTDEIVFQGVDASDRVFVARNQAGVFDQLIQITVPDGGGLRLADVPPEDSLPDLVLVSGTALVALRNDGAGGFTGGRTDVGLPFAETDSIVTGDFDDDGHVDVVAQPYDGSDMVVVMGNASGFDAPESLGAFAAYSRALAADLDGDGDDDLAFAVGLNDSIAVHPGSPEGLGPREIIPLRTTGNISSMELDAGAPLEIVSASSFDGFQFWSKTFESFAPSGPTVSGEPYGDVVISLLPDGTQELVTVAVAPTAGLIAFLRAADGTEETLVVPMPDAVAPFRRMRTTNSGSILAVAASGDALRSDRGPDGRLLPGTQVTSLSLAESAFDFASGDVDGDAFEDLVVLVSDGEASTRYLLMPAALQEVPVAASAEQVFIADLNDDGRSDVVVLADFTVFVFQGTPTGLTTVAAVQLPLFSQPIDLVVADEDGDFLPELIIARVDPAALSGSVVDVWHNEGDFNFAEPEVHAFSATVEGIELADLDGDGLADIAGSSELVGCCGAAENGALHVLLRRPGGGYRPAATHFVGGYDPVIGVMRSGDGELPEIWSYDGEQVLTFPNLSR